MGFWSDLLRGMILKDQTSTAQGYTSAEEHKELLGRSGTVIRDLRPAGAIRIDGNPVDVVSEGEFIPKGQEVQIIAVQGNRIVVR